MIVVRDSMRILVVEDDQSVGRFVQSGLEQEGYAVDAPVSVHYDAGGSTLATAVTVQSTKTAAKSPAKK